MEDRLRRKVLEMSRGLALEEKDRLEAAGTLVDLERLTTEIGDEFTRQLTGFLLSERAESIAQEPQQACPACGKVCEIEEEREPLILKGLRGEIEYQEPRCYCSRCRRAFFPSGEDSSASCP